MHMYIVHDSHSFCGPVPFVCTLGPKCYDPSLCFVSTLWELFLGIGNGLPHGIGCARCRSHLPPSHGFCGDNDVLELVLGDDIDSVGVCRSQAKHNITDVNGSYKYQ